MDLQMSRAGDVLALSPCDPAGVLPGIVGHHILQLQSEVILFGSDFDAIGQFVIQWFVVPQPGGAEAGHADVGGTREAGGFAG